MATRNRRPSLLQTLGKLSAVAENPRIVVVDNASADGTCAAVAEAFPNVTVIALEENVGPFARTLGVRAVDAPYVAFSDDDSWWGPGALGRAADALDRFPALAVVAGHVLVGEVERDDETTLAMGASPLACDVDLPGPPVLGFVACGSVVRRDAFLIVGGFSERRMGLEETLLAVDLVAAGWQLAYVREVVAHHHPSVVRDAAERRREAMRNALWFAWRRRPASVALGQTIRVLRSAATDRAARKAIADLVRDARRLVAERAVVDRGTEFALRRVGL